MTNDLIEYDVLTEEEALGLLPKGDYPAVISQAEQKTSKAGKPYVVLTVDIKDKKLVTWCTLPYMLKHAADATGNSDKYQSKSLRLSDFVNKSCVARVKIQQPNEYNSRPKNIIWDFAKTESQNNAVQFDDTLPF